MTEAQQPPFASSHIFYDQSDLPIEVMVAEKGGSAYHRISFYASEIAYLMELEEGKSAIVLKSNVTIAVALPYAQLKKSIDTPDVKQGWPLDLTSVSGEALKEVQVPGLSEEDAPQDVTGLMIHAVVRKEGSNITAIVDFSEKEIVAYERIEGEVLRAKTKKSLRVIFNKSANIPFDPKEAYIDMPYEEYMHYLNDAKKRHLKVLNLEDIFAQQPSRYGFIPG